MKRSAFTIIELLVVISIISLLSSVVLSSLSTARAKARDARRMSDLRQINTAVLMYEMDNNKLPLAPQGSAASDVPSSWAQLETLLKPYISKLPVDPCQECEVRPRNPKDRAYYIYNIGPSNNDPNKTVYIIGANGLETSNVEPSFNSY